MPDPEKLDPSGANEGRETRADLIDEANKASLEEAKAEQKAADAASKPVKEPKTTTVDGKKATRTKQRRTAPQHVVKRDDAGAREQQKSARENAPEEQLAEFDGPPVVAPQFETLKGKFEILDSETSKKVTEAAYGRTNLRAVGEGFPAPGEVIIDFALEDGSQHQRVSAWTSDGWLDAPLTITGPGTWIFHAESPVTQVGEGRDDHLPVIRVGKEQKLVVR